MPDGPGGFSQDFSCPAILRCPPLEYSRISPKGLSPAMARLSSRFGYPEQSICRQVLQPRMMRCHISGLGSSAFARHYLRNHCYFLFLRVLRCFSSPGSPLRLTQIPESLPVGCPIRKSAGQWVFAPRRSLSQLVTSFIASESQGILHVPLSPFLGSFDLTHT